MDLKVLFELKERMEHCAIAGTALISEDFRLKRAVDNIAPLAAASPVFAKIKAGADDLLNAPVQQRGEKLLDVLGLVDAVVYTQGVSGIEGELEPLSSGGAYCELPYSVLSVLNEALTGTGSGRYAVVRQYSAEHPEYFSDLRVIGNTVKALDSTYGELAELAESILYRLGPDVIPLLMEDFDPEGKKGMERRVRLVSRLGLAAKLGGEDGDTGVNEWLRTVLPDSKKGVRKMIIAALGLFGGNTQLLVDLCRSEKGDAKKEAMRSLAYMDTPEAREYWENDVRKHPDNVFLLEDVTSDLAADLAADAITDCLENILSSEAPSDKDKEKLSKCIDAVAGKYSDKMHVFWLRLLPDLDRIKSLEYEKSSPEDLVAPAVHFECCLAKTVLKNPRPETFALARELYDKCPGRFIGAAFIADLIELPAGELYDRYSVYFDPKKNDRQRSERTRIISAMEKLARRDTGFCLEETSLCRLGDGIDRQYIPVPAPDPRWAQLLTDRRLDQSYFRMGGLRVQREVKIDYDKFITRFIDPCSPEVLRVLGEYFYEKLKNTCDIATYGEYLISCGWTRWEGVFSRCIEKTGKADWYNIRSLIERINAPGSVKADELKKAAAMIKDKKIKAVGTYYMESDLQRLIPLWESGQ